LFIFAIEKYFIESMKTPSQKLFHLVKNLTPAEKRYIRISFGKSQVSDDKFILLFNTIDKQIELDESKLQRKVYPKEQLEGKKYTELKSYLYLSILRILQDFDRETNIEYRLQNMLGNIRVLYRRALYDECFDQMNKLRKLAEIHEDYQVLLELLRWKKQIAHAKGDISFFSEELEEIILLENEYFSKVENIIFYKNAFYKIYSTIRKQGLLGHEKMVELLATTVSNEAMQSEEKALSQKAKILFYRSRSLYAYATLDKELFYTESKKLIELMEQNTAYLQEEVSEYISAINNFIVSCLSVFRYDEATIVLEKLRNVVPKTLDDQVKVHRQYYQSKLQLCMNTADFKQGLLIVKQHQKESLLFERQGLTNNSFYYAYFFIYFASEEYDNAHQYLNEWLFNNKTGDRGDLQIIAKLLNLILHFEMGNTELLDSLLKSTAHYINRHGKIVAFERLLMRFIREAYNTTSKKELIKLLEEIKQEFEVLSQDEAQNIFVQYFDFIAWLESKITGKTFAQTIREKFQNSNNNTHR
jgi:hypothetical protein